MFFDEDLLNSSSGWRSGQIQHLSLFQIWWQGQQQPKYRITIFSQDLESPMIYCKCKYNIIVWPGAERPQAFFIIHHYTFSRKVLSQCDRPCKLKASATCFLLVCVDSELIGAIS